MNTKKLKLAKTEHQMQRSSHRILKTRSMICSRVMYTMLIHISTECESSAAYCVCNGANVALHPSDTHNLIGRFYFLYHAGQQLLKGAFSHSIHPSYRLCVSALQICIGLNCERSERIEYGDGMRRQQQQQLAQTITATEAANNRQTREHFIHQILCETKNIEYNVLARCCLLGGTARFNGRSISCIQLSVRAWVWVWEYGSLRCFYYSQSFVYGMLCNVYTWCRRLSSIHLCCVFSVHSLSLSPSLPVLLFSCACMWTICEPISLYSWAK